MPKLVNANPRYRKHKASGQAVVTLNGADHYLGPHGTAVSRREYDRLVGEWLATGRQPPRVASEPEALAIVELVARYWAWCQSYYVFKGKPTGEPARIRDALKPLNRLYGDLPVSRFGPVALKAVRQGWIDGGLARRHINQRVGRIKRLFKWGVAEELVPAVVFQSLQAVDGLRYGHTEARETEPIKPVPDAFVDAVLPYVTPTVRAMIEIQRVTGMRGGEVCAMRAIDIDTSGPVWIYEPAAHKNQWRGHRRLVPLGPRAQEIVKQFLGTRMIGYLFSPRASVAERNEQKRQMRKTKVQPSQADRRKRRTKKQPGDWYDSRSYHHAVRYGIVRANKARLKADPTATPIPNWHPHQLRHTHATAIRKQYGLEGPRAQTGERSRNLRGEESRPSGAHCTRGRLKSWLPGRDRRVA
jgi:integrase